MKKKTYNKYFMWNNKHPGLIIPINGELPYVMPADGRRWMVGLAVRHRHK